MLLLVMVAHCSFAQKWVNKKITNDISIKVPSNFLDMSNSERVTKYVSSRIPIAVFTSEDRNADLGINKTGMQWTEKDTELIYSFYKSSIQSFFDDIIFYKDEIKEINGRTFIVFEFQSVLKDDNSVIAKKPERNYTHIAYTSYEDQVLLFNFGCPGRFQQIWQPVAADILGSIQIKD